MGVREAGEGGGGDYTHVTPVCVYAGSKIFLKMKFVSVSKSV